MKVYVTAYEVIGDGLPISDEHHTLVDAAEAAHWSFVESVGGVGLRPARNGGLRSVFFQELPAGWRKIGSEGSKIECVPHKGSSIGKRLAKSIAELPKAPDAQQLSAKLGYQPSEMAIDGNRIFFPWALQVMFPAKRMFLRLPRFITDGFEPNPSMLRALPESEFMKAVEEHNAEAHRLREAGK